jgi:hypothetical protein
MLTVPLAVGAGTLIRIKMTGADATVKSGIAPVKKMNATSA